MCSNGQVTCRQFVKNIQRGNESKRITLAIVGLEAFERYYLREKNGDYMS